MDIQQQTNAPSSHTTNKVDPLGDGISSIELVRVSGSDLDIANAARVSFGKFATELTERDKKLIRYLMEHSHTSPFEHNQLSFRIAAPIFVVRQWMRHRMHSYNEVSYRYVQAPLQFFVPSEWRHQDKANRQSSAGTFTDEKLKAEYLEMLQTMSVTYEKLLAAGVCRELARGVLPLCTYTEFIFTSNLHALMHFMKLRLHPGAQQEIRMYALGMLELALPHFPVALQAWKEYSGASVDHTDALTEQLK
jgi:thymidylate synthase (FAD)